LVGSADTVEKIRNAKKPRDANIVKTGLAEKRKTIVSGRAQAANVLEMMMMVRAKV
jgi:hypothetical protein